MNISTIKLQCLVLALAIVPATLLTGCGGGGSDAASAATISGQVVDGPIQGASVFLDLNNNFKHDAGEPISLPSAADGGFSIVIGKLSSAQLAIARLVTHIPSSARDADDAGQTLAQAGRQGFSMMTPASAFITIGSDGGLSSIPAFVSPLTTLVSSEMSQNGLTLAQAKAAVQEQLGLVGKDPMADFIKHPDAQLGELAKAIANELGSIGQQVASTAQGSGGQAVRDQVVTVFTTLKAELPSRLIGLVPDPLDEPGVGLIVDDVAIAEPQARTASAPSTNPRLDFVVVFKATVGNPEAEAKKAASAHGGDLRFTYSKVIKGFAVSLPAQAAPGFLKGMASNPNVDYVEQDAPVKGSLTTQTSTTWGLDRADQRALPLSRTYSYDSTGSGVRAYVVDTGILASHTDFGGRVLAGYSAISDGYGTTDCNGHGTHVAGTIAGTRWGIAKAATLIPVRVLDCTGSGAMSGVIAGLEWIIKNGVKPAVVNMSLGGAAYSALDTAVANLIAAGFTTVVAAGNDNADACLSSPARAVDAITVGATTSADARASFSNYGTCLDIFAPGASITSSWYTSNTATASVSGTSMAAPHVAGLAALILQATPSATPAMVTNSILAASTNNVVTSPGAGSVNKLIYTLASSSTTTEPATTSTVSIANLVGSGSKQASGWRALVTVSVKDSAGKAVSGATVNGAFTVGGSSVSCTTGSTGNCSVTTGKLSNSTTQTIYSVKQIAGTNMVYEASANTASSVVVKRP